MAFEMIYNLKDIPKRYYVVLLLFLCDLLGSYLATSPNMVIPHITTPTKRTVGSGNETEFMPPEVNWTSKEKGIALGAHGVGVMLAAFGGALVHRMGGATFLAIGMLGAGIITILDPFLIRFHVYLFVVARVVFGWFEGLCIIGNTDILARWIPQNERVRALASTPLGHGFGAALSFPVSGVIIHHLGWPNVFFISGAMVLIWCFIWITFVANDPSEDRFITRKEREYLSDAINYISKDKVEIPYRKIFTSVPVYALLNEYFVAAFTFSFTKLLPLYVKDVHINDVQLVGLVSSIPQFASLIVQPVFAHFADHMRSSGYSIGKLHKGFLFWGQSFTVLFFFLTVFGSNVIGCVVCITLAIISFSLSQVSYSAIVIDIAGQYAGFLKSLTMVARSSVVLLNPVIMGFLVQNHTQSEWNSYFLFISIFTMYGVIMFVIFGSGDLQPWATVSPQEIIRDDVPI